MPSKFDGKRRLQSQDSVAKAYFSFPTAVMYVASALIPAVTLLFLPDASQIDLLLSGCLFAAHPIHTEAVSGLVGRAELLAGLFYVLAVIAYAR